MCESPTNHMSGCPGSRMVDFRGDDQSHSAEPQATVQLRSQLRQWPIQLHLVSPRSVVAGWLR